MSTCFSTTPGQASGVRQRNALLREQERIETALDEALGLTFPASDPVALDCSVSAFAAPDASDAG